MKPKFKIDDIVIYKDTYTFNPAEKTTTIAKITGIHIKQGDGPLRRGGSKGIVYSLSTSGLMPREEQLELYIEAKKDSKKAKQDSHF